LVPLLLDYFFTSLFAYLPYICSVSYESL